MIDISIIIPTRKRPASVTRIIQSIMDTADNIKTIELCFYIDKDDIQSRDTLNNLISINDIKISYTSSDSNPNLSEMWNIAYTLSSGKYIMLSGDDCVFRTKSWDTIVKNKFKEYIDDIVLIFGDDGILHERLATQPFITRKWIEISGFYLPPYFKSDFCDTWLDDVAKRINRRVYIPEIYNEHMHFVVGKADKDDTTLRRLHNHEQQNPETIYNSKIKERIEHAQKLSTYINNFKME